MYHQVKPLLVHVRTGRSLLHVHIFEYCVLHTHRTAAPRRTAPRRTRTLASATYRVRVPNPYYQIMQLLSVNVYLRVYIHV